MLPTLASAVDDMLESAYESLATLRECADRPSVLDDTILNRFIAVHSEQLDDHWLYEEQFSRWQQGTLSDAETIEVNRLRSQSATLKATNEKILAIAEKIAPYTIDKIRAMDDRELGLKVLSGEINGPGADSEVAFASPADRNLVERIDKQVAEIVAAGGSDIDVFAAMADDMPAFKTLLDTTSSKHMSRLCRRYNGFYCYTQVLEGIAQGIASGDIQVP